MRVRKHDDKGYLSAWSRGVEHDRRPDSCPCRPRGGVAFSLKFVNFVGLCVFVYNCWFFSATLVRVLGCLHSTILSI